VDFPDSTVLAAALKEQVMRRAPHLFGLHFVPPIVAVYALRPSVRPAGHERLDYSHSGRPLRAMSQALERLGAEPTTTPLRGDMITYSPQRPGP